ncbi:MAG: hypothetical protein UX65_C0013G0007 [Parcubacteria group bacterium GW2011_GWB1_46_8]|nr:MAG: hypothetical protein UX65_C0013G0007 [Parcubacteria group bacterium GW2011_GWB1_46_8]
MLFAMLVIALSFGARVFFNTPVYLSDIGGLGAFLTVFGTLYGILIAFVVFEVWGQYNKAAGLINLEAQALERLYRLTLYFRDAELARRMKEAIFGYANKVIEEKFQTLGSGGRNKENSVLFRKISLVIRDIRFDDDHDQVVFSQILDHYGHLGEIRTERVKQSLERLPTLLKTFIYASSGLALFSFVVMPFASFFYHALAIGVLGFTLTMVFQLIEDLDNPFVGHWNVTPEPFERTIKHIEEDYS